MTAPMAILLAGIAAFVLATIVGPFLSHPDYRSVSHSVSELAGQNMPNAWIMRAGFVAFGAAVVVATLLHWRSGPAVSIAVVIFGLAMIAAAIWSHLPIDLALGGSKAEDDRHSIAATVMGAAFAAACAAKAWLGGRDDIDWLSILGLVAAIGLPLLMLGIPMIAGAAQRVMFGISFVWLVRSVATA